MVWESWTLQTTWSVNSKFVGAATRLEVMMRFIGSFSSKFLFGKEFIENFAEMTLLVLDRERLQINARTKRFNSAV